MTFLLLLIWFFLLIFIFSLLHSIFLDALFVSTPKKIALKMLKMADLKKGEKIFDLGCGISTLPILAAKKYSVQAFGIEKVPLFCLVSMLRVKFLGLGRMIKIRYGDFFDEDMTGADAVTIYLSTAANAELKEKFERELKPGARVVSRRFKIPGWKESAMDKENKIYLYKI